MNIKNPKCDGYQGDPASIIYRFFDKKASGSGANDKIKQNLQMNFATCKWTS